MKHMQRPFKTKQGRTISIRIMGPQNCQCFFDAPLADQTKIRNNGFKSDQLKKTYRTISRRCHPDKVSTDAKEAVTKAQTLINIAHEVLGDKNKQRIYIMTRRPPDEVSHKCSELIETLKWINTQFKRPGEEPFPNQNEEQNDFNRSGADNRQNREPHNSEESHPSNEHSSERPQSPLPSSPSVSNVEDDSDTEEYGHQGTGQPNEQSNSFNDSDYQERTNGSFSNNDANNTFNSEGTNRRNSSEKDRRNRAPPESFVPKGY